MKILMVVEASGGGVGRHVLDLAAGLTERQHEVHIIYSPLRMDRLFSERKQSLAGVRFVPYSLKRSPGPSDLAALKFIRSYFKANGGFDLVHGHSSKAGALVRLATADLAPTVYTPHAFKTMDPGLSKAKKALVAAAEFALGQIGNGIILVSQDEYEHARKLNLPKQKLYLVKNGIKLPGRSESTSVSLELRKKYKLSEEAVVLGFVGRLVPQKAPEILFKAFELLALEHKNVYLFYVGQGPLLQLLQKKAAGSPVKDRVIFAGEQDGSAMMSIFDVFVLPSRYEGMPYVMLEAQAAGLPLVSTKVGGIRDIVQPGRNGYLVEVEDYRELALKLEDLVLDPHKRRLFGQESQARAKLFTVEQMVRQTLEVYESISQKQFAKKAVVRNEY